MDPRLVEFMFTRSYLTVLGECYTLRHALQSVHDAILASAVPGYNGVRCVLMCVAGLEMAKHVYVVTI